MLRGFAGSSVAASLAVAALVVGSVTALTITGHVPGDVAIGVILSVAGGGAAIAGTHVGGTVAANTAASQAAGLPPAPATPQATGDVRSGAGAAPTSPVTNTAAEGTTTAGNSVAQVPTQ